MKVGNKIKQLKKEHKVTRKEIATATKIDVLTIKSIEVLLSKKLDLVTSWVGSEIGHLIRAKLFTEHHLGEHPSPGLFN